MTPRIATNTLIIGLSEEQLGDETFFEVLTEKIEILVTTESVEFIKLPSLQRILIVFQTHAGSIRAYQALKEDKNVYYRVVFSVVDTKIPESTFLQLPDPGKKYVISPPPSPPVNWVDKPEEGPNMQVIHNPQELSDLLFRRLGARIERYDSDAEDLEQEEQDQEHEDRASTPSSPVVLFAGGNDSSKPGGEAAGENLRHEDFINADGRLEVPKNLVDRLNGKPIIVLDPPHNNTANGKTPDGRNEEGISVNRVKTAMPPPTEP